MVKTWQRFRRLKRGYYSFWILVVMLVLLAFAELFINSRALVVRYQGQYFFPIYGDPIPGEVFGLGYSYETHYRELSTLWADNPHHFVVMPLIPYNPYENDYRDYRDVHGHKLYHPLPPSLKHRHVLGTDKTARDVLARLVYAFRMALLFSLVITVLTLGLGVTVGCVLGYLGGRWDIVGMRVLEIFSAIPMLYVFMIVGAMMPRTIWVLGCLFVVFGWMAYVGDVRSLTFSVKARDSVSAARVLGAGHGRVLFRHVLPHTFVVVIVAIPFAVTSGLSLLTGLDYLGFGLPPPTPSIGELMAQGQENALHKPWILASVVSVFVAVLIMVTFIGESVREAFDPKTYVRYE